MDLRHLKGMKQQMNEIVDKSSHFKQACQLLVSLIEAIVHPHLRKPGQIQMMLTIGQLH